MVSASDAASTQRPGPLAGLRVLDLTRQIAGPYCTKLLADYGADVVKIEQPGLGDPSRHTPPFFHDDPNPEGSLHFLYLNTNKRSITLDLKSVQGRQAFLDLARDADVVVENFQPGTIDELGIGWDTLHALNPRLILTSISNFGQTGPYRDLPAGELVEYAMSGMMAVSGREDLSPLKHGLSQAQYGGGAYAAWTTTMLAFAQSTGAPGQWIDVSIQAVLASELTANEAAYAWIGGVQGRRAPAGDGTGNGLSNITPCADGYVIVQHRNTEPWSSVINLLREPALDDERFQTNDGRAQNAEALYNILLKALSTRTKLDLVDDAAVHRVLMGIVQDPKDMLNCPQLAARKYWVDVDHPVTGTMKFPGAPVVMPGAPWSIRRHAPLLGEHTDEVLKQGWGNRTAPAPVSKPAGGLPLAGIRVLDLSSVVAMPYTGGMLTDLGAEVIKIEALQRTDSSRSNANGMLPDNQSTREPWNVVAGFSVINRGKRDVTINMTEERGREVFRELVKHADIVVENYTARVMRAWDLDYEHLKAINPDIIMVSNTGFGHDSPWESYPAQGTSLEATTGIAHFSGYLNGRPWTVGASYPDYISMWHTLFAIGSALRRRTLTGQGDWIDLGMYQANVSLLGEALLDYIANGRLGGRLGNRDHLGAVQGCYRTQGVDRWMVVSAQSDEQWRALCDVLGSAAWGSNGAPTTLADAHARHDEVDRVLEAWAAARTREAAVDAMRAAGLPSGPVNDVRDLFLDPQLLHRGFYELVDHDPSTGVGRRPLIGRAFKTSDTQFRILRPAPTLGEANEYVLKDLLGMSDERFNSLVEAEITGRRAPLEVPMQGLPIEKLQAAGRYTQMDPEYRNRLGNVPAPV